MAGTAPGVDALAMDEPSDDEAFDSSERGGANGWVGTAVGLVLAVVIAGPMVGRGPVLLLDWVSGPYPGPIGPLLGADGSTLGGSPFLLVLRLLRRVAGPSVSSWLPLVAWMPVVGWGVGRLTQRGGWHASAPAAALACCNPFTLDRLAVGQIGVLWGYALLPLAILTLTSEPKHRLRWAARAGLVGAALTAVSPHFFAYWLVVVLVSVALLPMARRRAVGALAALGGALCATSYLFVVRVPSLPVTQADLAAYRTRVEPPGLAVTIATLRGFWRPSDVTPVRSMGSWAILLLVGALVAVGVRAAWRRREVLVIAMTGLAGAVMAVGDQGPLRGLYRFAFEHAGPFRILREPQKASALLAIAFSVLFGFGVARLVSLIAWDRARVVGAAVLVAVPLGVAPALPTFGARAETDRPSAAWREVDRLVGSGPAGVLALPWHLYLRYPSTRAPVANLAPTRLRAPVVSGDNVELPGLATTSTRLRSKYLEDRFRRGQELTDFGAQIAPAGLGWVLLVKTADWSSYQWLEQQQDLVRILDTPELALYRSNAPTELSNRSASRGAWASWDVRSPAGRPVAIPEVAEGRWSSTGGRVETNDAGAPSILSSGTSVRSMNVQSALTGLVLSGVSAGLLSLVAVLGSIRRFPRRASLC